MSGAAIPAMAPKILCRLEEIPDGEGRGFAFGSDCELELVFVLRRGGRVFGYRNSCPHTGTPLDMVPDRFLARDRRHILCATHGAQFRIEDGYCVSGPCKGNRLEALPLAVIDGAVVLDG